MPENLEISAVATGLEKDSVFIPAPKKDVQTTAQLHSFISHTSKVMLKILQARLQQYVNQELPDLGGFRMEAGLRKGRGTRRQIASIR